MFIDYQINSIVFIQYCFLSFHFEIHCDYFFLNNPLTRRVCANCIIGSFVISSNAYCLQIMYVNENY